MVGQQFLRKQREHVLIWAAPLLIFGALFYQPLFRTISLGLGKGLFKDLLLPETLRVAWFTIWQAIVSAAIALVLATPIAFALYKVNFPGRRLVNVLITLPFVLPTIVVGIGFTSIAKNAPPLILIISANIFMNFGLAARIIGSTWRSIGNDEAEAADLDGAGKIRTFFSITFIQLRGAYAAAGFLVFLYCAANFGIILVLGNERTKSLETSIYINAIENLDLSKVASLVLMQTVLTINLFGLASRYSRSTINPFGSPNPGRLKSWGRRDLPAIAFTLLLTIGFVLTPLFSIFWRAFQFNGNLTFGNFSRLASSGARDVLSITLLHASLNSLRNAGLSLLICLGVGLSLAYILVRTRNRYIGVLFQLPLGISPVVIGLGYLITFTNGFFPLRSSWLVVPIAQSIVLIPFFLQFVLPVLRQIDTDLHESAQLDGSNDYQYWWQIQLPLIKRSILQASLYIVVISIGELGAANFLAYGDQATLPTVLYQLISHPGSINYGMALAASAILIIGSATIFSIAII